MRFSSADRPGGAGEVFVLLDEGRVHVVLAGEVGAPMSVALSLATVDVVRAGLPLDVHTRHLCRLDPVGVRFLEGLVTAAPGRPRLLDPSEDLLRTLAETGVSAGFEVAHRAQGEAEPTGQAGPR